MKRKVEVLCEMIASLGVIQLEQSQLWDIRQSVRTLPQDIITIRYQETTSEDRRFYVYCSYSDL
jgi:hypothetical protein